MFGEDSDHRRVFNCLARIQIIGEFCDFRRVFVITDHDSFVFISRLHNAPEWIQRGFISIVSGARISLRKIYNLFIGGSKSGSATLPSGICM